MINKGLSRLGAFFLYLVSLLPFWFLYLITDFLFVIVYYIIGYRRKVVQENLCNAFPEKTEAERHKIEKEYFRYPADLIIESIKMISASKKAIIKHVWPTNPEVIDNYFAEVKSVILWSNGRRKFKPEDII
jgi:KDO2-lipid IV(A) lauroyltransferase